MAALPQQALSYNDVFEEEENAEPTEPQTVHHIRANSSIMQLKKILGNYLPRRNFGPQLICCPPADSHCAPLQSPTVVKSVSLPFAAVTLPLARVNLCF